MSLREAVEEVAGQIEEEADARGADGAWLRVFSRQLRTACKAAGPDPAPGVPQIGGFPFGGESPSQQEHRLMEQARQEARAARRKGEGQEAAEGVMTCCVGGPADDTHAMRAAAMPEGAKTFVGGHVYELRGGMLVFVPPEAPDAPA